MNVKQLAVALLLAAASTAPIQAVVLVTHPAIPLDSLPTRALLLVADLDLVFEFEALVRREGQDIRLELQGLGCGPIYCDGAGFVPADLGQLAAGSYTVRLIIGGDEEATFPLEVLAGPRLSFVPAAPDALDAIRLRIEGDLGPCPSAAPPEIFGRLVKVTISEGSCPATAAAGALELALPALPAGEFTFELWRKSQLAAREKLRVLPDRPLLQQGRFELNVSWRDAGGQEGRGHLVQEPSTDSALYYFFDRANWELMVKVLDGCAINGHFWVFAAASTDVEYSFVVTDLDSPSAATFRFGNPLGSPAVAVTNIQAFPCLRLQ